MRTLLLPTLLVFALLMPAGAQTTPSDDLAKMLLDEIDSLEAQLHALRLELAQAHLEAAAAQRELAELKQFLEDHHEFGSDFQQYRSIKAIAEQEARERRVQQMRERRDAERLKRLEARESEPAQREARRDDRYRQAGFTPVGSEVYVSQMAFYYKTKDDIPYRFNYIPGFGRYMRFSRPTREIDFSSMTISGSVLNAAEETRHVGIAVTFFDENGNQVGGETVQVNNARPNVPYPFSATIEMALDRPFASSTTYVLFADPIAPPQETQGQPTTGPAVPP
jgi:hypothetical protein